MSLRSPICNSFPEIKITMFAKIIYPTLLNLILNIGSDSLKQNDLIRFSKYLLSIEMVGIVKTVSPNL